MVAEIGRRRPRRPQAYHVFLENNAFIENASESARKITPHPPSPQEGPRNPRKSGIASRVLAAPLGRVSAAGARAATPARRQRARFCGVLRANSADSAGPPPVPSF